MIDALNRNIEYLRISVTDRCNLRCMYCMPKEGIVWQPHSEMLTYDELIRLCHIFADLGISKIKLTGGEPLVRKNLHYLVSGIKAIEGIDNITLTTNGLLLAEQIDALASAGLDAVNISIDSLDEVRFKKITGCDGAKKVREAIEKVQQYDRIRLKLNCVPLKSVNEQDLTEIAAIAKDHRVSVRFIEMMPIGLGASFEPYTEDELKHLLEAAYGTLMPYTGRMGNGPCTYYTVDGFMGKIGFISAVTHQFCDKCNRIRLTSTGFLKACLQYDTGTDLKDVLRSHANDQVLMERIHSAIYHKPKGHHFGRSKDGDEANSEARQMFQIGG